MTMAKKLPLLAPSIHTFEVNGTYKDCEARRTVFMAIQKMVSAGKYYRIPYHGSSKKGYSYKRKDGGLTITLGQFTRNYTQTVKRAADNKRRLLPERAAYRLFCCPGFPKGFPLWHTTLLAKCSVLYLLAWLTGETGCGASCAPFAPAGKQAEFLRMGMSKKSGCFQRTAAGI